MWPILVIGFLTTTLGWGTVFIFVIYIFNLFLIGNQNA